MPLSKRLRFGARDGGHKPVLDSLLFPFYHFIPTLIEGVFCRHPHDLTFYPLKDRSVRQEPGMLSQSRRSLSRVGRMVIWGTLLTLSACGQPRWAASPPCSLLTTNEV